MDDIICSDRFLKEFPAHYWKIDVFYRSEMVWRGKRVCAPPPDVECIVTGHSDLPLTETIVQRYPSAVWWAINNATTIGKGIPLGITNDCSDSPVHSIYGNTEVMRQVAAEPRSIRNRVYMNFSLDTHPTRRRLFEQFKDVPWITVGSAEPTMEGRRRFLRDIRNHAFVLCPRGNGVDTHRLWETLYMGSIPIVHRDVVHRGWEDLPIAWVDSWGDVTPEWLDTEEERIRNGTFPMEKLAASYWFKKIREAIGTRDAPSECT